MQEYCSKPSSSICFGYLLELPYWGNSNKYPKHMYYEEIRIKQGLLYISFWPLRILYNSKFILMATSLGTNAVVVMRVHCIKLTFILFSLKIYLSVLIRTKLVSSNEYPQQIFSQRTKILPQYLASIWSAVYELLNYLNVKIFLV